ncbi:hypothetical protein QTP70_015939, partial [Hemibagrus guttatus]
MLMLRRDFVNSISELQNAEQLVDVFTDIFNISMSILFFQCALRLVPSLFTRLVKTQLPPSLDPLQFVYRLNRSMHDAIETTLHLALPTWTIKTHMYKCSSFNTIIPQHLNEKLCLLDLNTSLCNWMLDLLAGRLQSVQIRNSISSTTTMSTGAPQGCVLSPLLFTLLTNNCVAMHSSSNIIKFAGATTV